MNQESLNISLRGIYKSFKDDTSFVKLRESLTSKEQEFMKLYYGLKDSKSKTLEETAKLMNDTLENAQKYYDIVSNKINDNICPIIYKNTPVKVGDIIDFEININLEENEEEQKEQEYHYDYTYKIGKECLFWDGETTSDTDFYCENFIYDNIKWQLKEYNIDEFEIFDVDEDFYTDNTGVASAKIKVLAIK